MPNCASAHAGDGERGQLVEVRSSRACSGPLKSIMQNIAGLSAACPVHHILLARVITYLTEQILFA